MTTGPKRDDAPASTTTLALADRRVASAPTRKRGPARTRFNLELSGAVPSMTTSSKIVVAASKAVYIRIPQFVKYKLNLIDKLVFSCYTEEQRMEGADWVLPGTRSSSTAHAGRRSRYYVARTAPSTSWPRRSVLPTTAFESTSSHSSETASSASV